MALCCNNGQRRSKSGKTKEEVFVWLSKQQFNIRLGTYRTGKDLPFGQFIDDYMSDISVYNLRPRTYESPAGMQLNNRK